MHALDSYKVFECNSYVVQSRNQPVPMHWIDCAGLFIYIWTNKITFGYRLNPAQVHRLVPWLNRELTVLLQDNRAHIDYVMQVILNLLNREEIQSPNFHDVLHPYFGENTRHFIHEFHSFATSPFDMIGFDQNAEYVTQDRLAHSIVTEVQSSSSDSDSDVQVMNL